MPAATALSEVILKLPDTAGIADVSTAAQFARESLIEGDHADGLAVLLTEEHRRAGGLGLRDRYGAQFLEGDRFSDAGVDDRFDLRNLFGTHFREMTEVKTEVVVVHETTALLDVGPEHLAEGGLQEVCRGVVALGGAAERCIDGRARPGLMVLPEGVLTVEDDELILAGRVEYRDLLIADRNSPRSPTWPPPSA